MKHTQKLIICCLLTCLFAACAKTSPDKNSQPGPVITGAPIDSAVSTNAPLGPKGTKIAPTDPAERAALAVEAPAPGDKAGHTSITFSELSDFPFETDEDGKIVAGSVLPENIAKLDQTRVAVSGYVVPIEFKEDKVSGLILVRNQLLCCYGEEPKLNEWIFVTVDPPVEMVTERPVTLFGNFSASPDLEDGQVFSLYRMEATDMEVMNQ